MAGKNGRPSKGDRDAFLVRPPRPIGNVIRQRANALGMSYSDFVSSVVARELGMTEHFPQPSLHSTAQELPIADVA